MLFRPKSSVKSNLLFPMLHQFIETASCLCTYAQRYISAGGYTCRQMFPPILATRARCDYRTISVGATRLWLGRMVPPRNLSIDVLIYFNFSGFRCRMKSTSLGRANALNCFVRLYHFQQYSAFTEKCHHHQVVLKSFFFLQYAFAFFYREHRLIFLVLKLLQLER